MGELLLHDIQCLRSSRIFRPSQRTIVAVFTASHYTSPTRQRYGARRQKHIMEPKGSSSLLKRPESYFRPNNPEPSPKTQMLDPVRKGCVIGMHKVGVTCPSVGESEQENVAVSMIKAFLGLSSRPIRNRLCSVRKGCVSLQREFRSSQPNPDRSGR
jgi:hypothetical protein